MALPLQIVQSLIAEHVAAARVVALEWIESCARTVLHEHDDLREFIMGMGTAFFTYRTDRRVLDLIVELDDPTHEYLQPLCAVIDNWDECLQLTGEPMRFTADGPKITEW
jgi:hypothetical protein